MTRFHWGRRLHNHSTESAGGEAGRFHLCSICCRCGGPAEQCYETGLNKEMTIFNSFITNVVAKGIPPQALEGVYAMHYFYYDLSEFEDKSVAKTAKELSDLYRAKYKTPVDSYAAIAYTAYMEMFRGFEAAKSFEPKKVAAALMANNGAFTSVKGRPGGARITQPFTNTPASWSREKVQGAEERMGSV